MKSRSFLIPTSAPFVFACKISDYVKHESLVIEFSTGCFYVINQSEGNKNL